MWSSASSQVTAKASYAKLFHRQSLVSPIGEHAKTKNSHTLANVTPVIRQNGQYKLLSVAK